jgi:ATP-binding cassette subfamily B protein
VLYRPEPIHRGFEFRHVSLTYPGSRHRVLSDINLVFDPGERIALVGENDAGKTTLVKLLARGYDLTEGETLLDGIALRQYNVEKLRREIGIIFRYYMRYDTLASQNIEFVRNAGPV